MKICAYEVREDEKKDFLDWEAISSVELQLHSDVPSLENADLAAGCEGVTILGQGKIDASLLDRYWELGVRYLSTRTIGFNHIDLKHAEKIGMKVCNAVYAPNGVADFTVMMILMCLRNYKQAFGEGRSMTFPCMDCREEK